MNFEIYIDELTELKNRRYLLEKGEEILKNWKEGTFIIFDLDNFKEINDKFGHLKGDEVLKGISKILYAVFEGENNEVLRYAGDEFIIITKIKDRSTIEEKSKKLLETIRNYPYGIDYGLGKINLGASMGISNFPEDGFSIQELFEKSDSALYYCKKRGKFQYRFYSEVEEEIKKEKFLKEKGTPEEIVDREKEVEMFRNFIKKKEKPIHLKGIHGIGKTRLISFFINELLKEGKKFINITFKFDLKDVPFSSLCEYYGKRFEDIPFIIKEKIEKGEIDFIILDDIDYIDKYSKELFKVISKDFPSILSAGTDSVEWENIEIELQPLTKEVLIEYIKKIIPELELREDFVEWISKISKGVPYLIEECIRYSIFNNIISVKGSKFILNELPQKKPESITEIYYEKIKSLDRELRNFIASLSALGKSFKINVASKYIGINPGRFIDLADKAVNLHILEPSGRDSYSFLNENFRLFIYEKLSDDSKRKMHKRVIEIFEKIKDIPEEVLIGTLAFHSKLAGETKEAMEASLKLSQLAKRLEEREDIKKLLERRKTLKIKEIPTAPPPTSSDFPFITENIISLFGALESYRIYPENSKIVFDNILKLKNNLNNLLKIRKSFTISNHEGNLIVDGVLFPNQRLLAAQKIVELLNEYEIQSISFVYEVDEKELKTLLQILSKRSSEVKSKGGIENLEEIEELKNIFINQKVYIALGEELEAIKKIPQDIDKKIKEVLNLMKNVPDGKEWIYKLKDLIRELKSEDLKNLFYEIPEDEKILKEFSKLEAKEALKVRETLENELIDAEKMGKVEEAIKIKKIIKYIPEKEKLLSEEKIKILNYEKEDLLKDEVQKILKEVFESLSIDEKRQILKKIIENLSDQSALLKRKTLEIIEKYLEYDSDYILREITKYIKKEKEEEIIKSYLKIFINKIEEKIEKGEFEEIQDFAEIVTKTNFPEVEERLLNKLTDKYVNLKKRGLKDELIRIRVLFRIMEGISIPYLLEKVEKETLLSDLLKEMFKEKIKSSEEFLYQELKKEMPIKTLEIFFDTAIEENIKIELNILKRFLEHKSDLIKLKAIELIIIGYRDEGIKIIENLFEKVNETLKRELIKLIGKYNLEPLVKILIKFIEKKGKLQPEPEPAIVREVINSLSNFKENFEIGNAFIEALKPESPLSPKKSKPPEIKILIIRALKNFEPLPEWIEVIEKLTNDPNVSVKSSAKLLLQEWKKKLEK